MKYRAQFRQAEKIITKMGGATALSRLIGAGRNTIVKWRIPIDEQGRGGIIPQRWVGPILEAAAQKGVALTPDDWSPL